MPVCTFFGHRDCPSSIKPKLREVLIDLIENQSVDMFYVGNKGAFDRLVRSVLRELEQEYPQINYAVVLEHMPGKQNEDYPEDFSDTMLPEGIETVPPRFAIVWRNKWMLRQSDYVVTYITHSWGGAAQFAEMAVRQKKTVINLTEPSLRSSDSSL
ncbi:MAG: hypothetical protein KBS74_07235 [Clostridiales bacterium]|nr:hypothetical protein [Candidatus Cacconaster stercorequi]